MKLQDLLKSLHMSSRVTYHIGGNVCFHGSTDAPAFLWNLEDYAVSSVSGGSVWLRPIQ